jgi:phage-related minor tail protein
MALNIGELYATLRLDATNANTELGAFGESAKKMGEKFSSIGKQMSTMITLPVLAVGGGMIKLASDFNENLNKVDVAFGSSAGAVKAWAQDTTKSIGMSSNSALTGASLFGDFATSMGIAQVPASKMSMQMVTLAGDLASFKNVSTDQALMALNGVFTGETESLKMLGIVMNDASLQTFALSQGSKVLYKDMTDGEKAQLRMAFVLSKTKNAQGDFERTSMSTANQLKILTASVQDLGVKMGTALLPIITPLITKVTELANQFTALSPNTQMLIMKIVGIVAVIGPALTIIGSLITFVGTLATAFSAIGGVILGLSAPVVIMIASLVALGAGIIYLYKTNDEFRNNVIALWENVKASIKIVIDNLVIIFNSFALMAKDIWRRYGDDIMNIVKIAFDFISTIIKTAMDLIKNVILIATGLITGDWSKVWTGIKGLTNTVVNGIAQLIVTGFNLMKSVISTVLSGILTVFNTTWNRITSSTSTIIGGIVNGAISKFNQLKSSVSSIFSGIGSYISNSINGVKNIFNRLSLSFPKIKLPYFTISGKFGLNPISVPYLNMGWKAKGGIFDKPTIAGLGEAGREAIVPLQGQASSIFASAFLDRIQSMGGSFGTGGGITVNINGDVKNPAQFAKMISREIQLETDRKTRARGR